MSHIAEVKYELVLAEIRGQLGRRKMSQQELGHRAALKQSTISRRMTGDTAFTLPELFDVCAVLGLSVTDLLVAADRNRPRPSGAEGDHLDAVAGAGFEPATSGSRARLADVLDFPYAGRASHAKPARHVDARWPAERFPTVSEMSHRGTRIA